MMPINLYWRIISNAAFSIDWSYLGEGRNDLFQKICVPGAESFLTALPVSVVIFFTRGYVGRTLLVTVVIS